MGIPTESVGSLPRPTFLQDIIAQYERGEASQAELLMAQEKAAADSVHRMQETGQELVTDGEQRVCLTLSLSLGELFEGDVREGVLILPGLLICYLSGHRHAWREGPGSQLCP